MFPMIATLEEVRRAKGLFTKARSELVSEKIEVAEHVQLGIMVEVPSVSLTAEQFASEVDFFSIGTNDLTQYTFAAERGNKRVAHLSDPCHPAVLRQINMVVQAAHAKGKWVGVCGEMASDRHAIPILVGLGVDELSVTPGQVPMAKQAVRDISLNIVKTHSQRAIELASAKSVRELVDEFLIFEK
jgi:phosphoenolpyruvate-protein kinase (PTS system EI component)